MKKILTLLFLFFAVMIGFAQVPNMINYQGIARNSVGNVLPNQPISVKLSIRDLTATGAVVYSEIRNVTTNFYGLFSFGIGSPGATGVTGTIAGVNWAVGAKFLQVEIDPAGGSSFTNVGATQLLSVPYALYSNTAAPSGAAGGDLSGTYPNPTVARIRGVNVLATAPANRQVLKFNGTDWAPGKDSLILPFLGSDASAASFLIDNTRLTGQTSVISAIMQTTTGVSAAISGIDGSSAVVSPVENKTYGVIGITGHTGIGVGGYALNGTALRGVSSPTGLALHTNGPVRLQGISEGLGKVLTSDASGNATWQVLGGGGLGAVTGSGTLNYVPKWTPDGTTLGNSLIFEDGTNIGIGTITPSVKLDVTGVGRFTGASEQALIIRGSGSSSNQVVFHNSSDSWLASVGINPVNGDLLIQNRQDPGASTTLFPVVIKSGAGTLTLQDNNGLLYNDNGFDRFIIKTDGKVGIGTITPATRLDVLESGTTNGGINVQLTGASNANAAINVTHGGTGGGANIQLTNAGSGGRGVDVAVTGVGTGVFSNSAGGSGVWGITGSISAAGVLGDNLHGEAVVGRNRGGIGVGAVVGRNDSSGYGVRGFNTKDGIGVLGQTGISGGVGRAARFENVNGANNLNVVEIAGNGTGTSLFVNNTNAGAVNLAVFAKGGANVARISGVGEIFANGGFTVGGADIAEYFSVEGLRSSYEAGDVLVISQSSDRKVEKSSTPYSTLVSGVFATKAGMKLTEENAVDTNFDDMVPMGVIGVIPTKVCTEGGDIKRGDLLVTSSTRGVAMKADPEKVKVGQVLGKALQDFNATTIGKINVLVSVK